jgi:uncharacterized membrane protein
MWEHYRKTFRSIQAAIAIVSIVVFFFLQRSWSITLGFFLIMQIGSLVGAVWATRLRHKIQYPQLR